MLQNSNHLAGRVPDGFRAISLQTTDEIAVSGLIQPGDMVDILLVIRADALSAPGFGGPAPSGEARTLLENIHVLAVGTEMTTQGDDTATSPTARTITFALSPEQISTFALARSLGSIYLALRNPGDRKLAGPARATPRNLGGGGISAPAPAATRRVSLSPNPRRPVELVIGGESQTIFADGNVR